MPIVGPESLQISPEDTCAARPATDRAHKRVPLPRLSCQSGEVVATSNAIQWKTIFRINSFSTQPMAALLMTSK